MKKKKTGNQNQPEKRGLKLNIYTITFTAMFLLFTVGGGYQGGNWSLKTEGLPGLIRAIHEDDKPTSEDIFEKYKDSSAIKDPDKLLRMIKHIYNTDTQK